MDALTFYKLAKAFKHINAFAATVQSAHETGNWESYLWLMLSAHVQGCFDRESELLPLIEAAESTEELEAIVW